MKDNPTLFKDTSALILASGNAERLEDFNLGKPKCIIEFDGIPFLVSLLRWLRSQGIEKHFVTVQQAYSQQIEEVLKNNDFPITTRKYRRHTKFFLTIYSPRLFLAGI